MAGHPEGNGVPPDDQLRQATEELETAVDATEGETGESLADVANALGEIVADETLADHAVLDGHLNELRQIHRRVDGDPATHVERAIDSIETYRESVEQA